MLCPAYRTHPERGGALLLTPNHSVPKKPGLSQPPARTEVPGYDNMGIDVRGSAR